MSTKRLYIALSTKSLYYEYVYNNTFMLTYAYHDTLYHCCFDSLHRYLSRLRSRVVKEVV